MKNLRSLLVVSIVMFAVLIGSTSSTFAQEFYQPPTTVELEEFRQEMDQMMQELYRNRETLRQNKLVREVLEKNANSKSAPALAQVRQQLREMNYEELAIVYKAFTTQFPDWRELPQLLGGIANKIAKKSDASPTSDATINDNCQDAFNADPSYADWSLAQGFTIAADGAQNLIPPPFNVGATAAYVAAGEAALVLDTLNKILDRCQSDKDFESLRDQITESLLVTFTEFDILQSEVFGKIDQSDLFLLTQIGNLNGIINSNIINTGTRITDNATINTANITTALTNAESNIVNNANTGTTTLNTNLTNAKTEIVTNLTNAKTEIINNLTNAKTEIVNNDNQNTQTLNTNLTNTKTEIVNNDNQNTTNIVNTSNQNAQTLNTNLTNAQNTIVANDNTNTTNIVNNDNANKNTIVANDNTNATNILNNGNANTTALNDLVLRSQIEADLATESNGVKVAWYMTPTANGGKLDLVKQIVTLTLANMVAAGGSIGNAQSFLTQANADKVAGNFKSAYDNYRKAYKAAAN